MRTHLEFNSALLKDPDGQGNTFNPDIHGRKLAEFLAKEFGARGFDGTVIEEDWGWMVSLKSQPFALWLGCGSYEDDADWLVFIEPSTPVIRKWLAKIDTRPEVAAISELLEEILVTKGGATNLKWWSDQDSGRK